MCDICGLLGNELLESTGEENSSRHVRANGSLHIIYLTAIADITQQT